MLKFIRQLGDLEDGLEMPNCKDYLDYEWCQGIVAAKSMQGLCTVHNPSLLLSCVQLMKI